MSALQSSAQSASDVAIEQMPSNLGRSISKQPFWWPALLAALGFALASRGMSESLWVDELHTSWAIAGSAADVVERSRAGNQSPIYPWAVQGLTWTFCKLQLDAESPATEWMLRLISALSFAASLVLGYWICWRSVARSSPARTSPLDAGLIAAALLGWLLWDRTQLFYATEARVYGLLQLLSLMGWYSLIRYVQFGPQAAAADGKQSRSCLVWLMFWWLAAVASVHFHVIAGLSLGWQVTVGSAALLLPKNRPKIRIWCIAVFSMLLLALPAAWWAVPVWNRRAQWESFAGDASLRSALLMFPLLPLLIPVATGRLLGWILERFKSESGGSKRKMCSESGVWLVAFVGPWVTAWALTAANVAPLMHQRYVLCSALPLTMFAVGQLMLLRVRTLQILTVLGGFAWLVTSQGTAEAWRHGQILGTLRGEDWRQAVAWVNAGWADGDEVWCASGLIEGNLATPPLENDLDRYLSFPLRGMYRVADQQGRKVDPHALVGDASQWPLQWGPIERPRRLFLVCRAPPQVIERILAALQASTRGYPIELVIEEPPRGFGSICAARIRLAST